jgi:hypothetical protein
MKTLEKILAGAALSGALLIGTPARADLVAPTTGGQARVRVNNPSAVSVTDSINGQLYTLGAHQTVEETVDANRIVVVPGDDSMGNKFPDPVVDVETGQNGFISSPPLYTLDDLAYDGQLFGLGTGATLLAVSGNQQSRIAVYTLAPDGTLGSVLLKDLPPNSVTAFTPDQLFGALAPETTMGVEYVRGSGQAALVTRSSLGDERYQRTAKTPGTLLGRLFVDKWIKPPSKPLKLNAAESRIALTTLGRVLAEYAMTRDARVNLSFNGDVTAGAAWLAGLVDGDLSNGELYGNTPVKEKNGQVQLLVQKKNNGALIEYRGLAEKVPDQPFLKITINATDGYEEFKQNLLPQIAKAMAYYENPNASPKTSGALWAHN